MRKPLGRKAYGSIPHLPGSRLGSSDHKISEGQAKIATVKLRDKHDRVICQEKLDGSNVAVAMLEDGRIVPLTRSGYLAESSPYLQHHLFSDWVFANQDRFYAALKPGEWISGEWLALAHGTRYELQHEPFVVFDLWINGERCTYNTLMCRLDEVFEYPRLLHLSSIKTCSIVDALSLIEDKSWHGAIDSVEGAVWRVERHGKVEFLCKYVRPDKVDGIYLSEISGKPPAWNENLEEFLPPKAISRLKEYSEKFSLVD